MQFFERERISIEPALITNTIHCKPGAAEALLEAVYTLITKRPFAYLLAGL